MNGRLAVGIRGWLHLSHKTAQKGDVNPLVFHDKVLDAFREKVDIHGFIPAD
jgi:hypothetical protein